MLDYKSSGVNITAGNEAVTRIKDKVKSTFSENVLTSIGSFGAMYDVSFLKSFDNPILIQSIDGVGTKLKIAKMMGLFQGVGEDIVNHCADDILCQGATPHTFLDYIACDVLAPSEIEEIVLGMVKACKENKINLIGGETAEMPGVYLPGEHDIAGCITGVVERDKIVTGDNIKEGDIILGLASSGLHTNGYSLVRKIFFEQNNYTVDSYFDELGCTLGEELIKPHKSYVRQVLPLIENDLIKGIAHLTGGGFIENIPRILPPGLKAEIRKDSWDILPIFDLIRKLGEIDEKEMYRVFNMGIGMVLVVAPEDLIRVKDSLVEEGAFEIGEIVGDIKVRFV